MASFTTSPTYRRCQARFDAVYPGFADAGQRYAGEVARYGGATKSVLDVGAGRMSLAAEALRTAGWSVGVDLEPQDLAANRTVTASAVAGAEALPFRGAAFDLVISQWVVEHFAAPERAFAEMSRVLAPHGHVVLFSTNRLHPVAILGRLIPSRARGWLIRSLLRRPAHESHPVYYRANTPERLRTLAESSGLQVRSLDFVGNPFYCAFSYPLFLAALAYERLTDRPPLHRFKLYWVAVLEPKRKN